MSGFAFIEPRLLPTVDELVRLRHVANGTEPADLIVRGGEVLAVHTGEFLARDVVIAGRHIAAVTPVGHFEAAREIDARGQHVVPTFIDTHLHIEYTMLRPSQLARLSVPKGTTSVLADPNCMGNVLAGRGMDYMGETAAPFRIFQQVTPTIPSFPELELGGQKVEEEETLARLRQERTVTLGESSPFDLGRVAANRYRETLSLGRRITGHTARLSGEPLWSYLAAGVGDDHNAATPEEVIERIRLGAALTLMAGSMNDNTEPVFADLELIEPCYRHITFCADDKHVGDLVDEGHIDHHVRQAIRFGVPVAEAYRMATLNAALYYRIDHLIGAVVPSRLADLQLIGDLAEVRPSLVLVGGEVVAEDGRALFADEDPIPEWTRETIRLHPSIGPASFRVAADGPRAWVQAMEMYDGYFKRAFHVELEVEHGNVVSDPERDVLKVAVVDRHHATDNVGIGFVRGFGLRRGAIAASNNCTNQNIIVLGADEESMARAVHEVRALGGGYAVVAGGEVLATVPLAVGGIIGEGSWEEVYAALKQADAAAAGLGCETRSPFMIMAFVGLAAVPDLGLTERGLIDVSTQSFIDPVLQEELGRLRCRCPNHLYPIHGFMDPATAGR